MIKDRRRTDDLCSILIRKDATYNPLDTFWDKHNKKDEQEAEDKQQEQASEGYQKTRVLSVSTLSLPGGTHSLPPHHPALALPDLLAAFGPLVFPLFRAALLQRRILILGEAPVEQMCDFVYNISILSTISRSLGAVLPHVEGASSRMRPLFCVGVADISTLESMKGAWIACTTDDVLASKPQLFDLLVILPKSTSIQRTGNQTYPTMIDSTPELARTFPKHGLRATQRDARRYAGLKLNIQALSSGAASNGQVIDNDNSDAASSSSTVTILDQREAVEPVPWSVAAYTSLIWWVSAGDRRSGLMEAEEQANEQDEGLLHDSLLEESKTKEVTMIAYFQKLSALLFSVLANAIDRSSRVEERRYHDDVNVGDDGTDRQPLLGAQTSDDKEAVEITEEDVRTMGLDIWSESDRRFILEMVRFWWKREATVRSTTIECCGIRIL